MRRSSGRTLGRNPKMEAVKVQFRHRSNLFSRNPKHTSNVAKLNVLIFALIARFLGLFCYILLPSAVYRNSVKRKLGIVIDGGSTGTRIHVFEYRIRVGGVPVFDFGQNGLASMRVNPGFLAYVEGPEGAGRSSEELVEFGRKRDPMEFWGETAAGLRMSV